MGLFWVPVRLFQVRKYRLSASYSPPHLFHAHPRGESYFDFSAVGHTSTSVQYAGPLSWSLPPKHHDMHFCSAFHFLRAILEGSMFWVGSSCAFDIPQGPDLMTSVPYDQRNCWFFCLPATASGASADSLACTSIRKDFRTKQLLTLIPLWKILHHCHPAPEEQGARVSGLNPAALQLSEPFEDMVFGIIFQDVQVLLNTSIGMLWTPSLILIPVAVLRDICVLCSQACYL